MKKRKLLLTLVTTTILTILVNITAFAFPMNNNWSTNQWVGPNYCTSGNIVRCVQILVSAAGFDPKGIDGYYGTNTQTAIENYQKKYAPPGDGIVGTNTWSQMHNFLIFIQDGYAYNPYYGEFTNTKNFAWSPQEPGQSLHDAGFVEYVDYGNWDVLDKYGNQYSLYPINL